MLYAKWRPFSLGLNVLNKFQAFFAPHRSLVIHIVNWQLQAITSSMAAEVQAPCVTRPSAAMILAMIF